MDGVENILNIKDLFEDNPLPMWIYDLDSLAFLEVNDAAVHSYGYSKEEFKNMTLLDIRPPEEISKLKGNLSQKELVYERSGLWKHRKKSGEKILVEIISHSLTNNLGKRLRLVIANDVSERIWAEKALRRSEERYRLLFDNSVEAIYIYDASQGKIIDANKAVLSLLGYSLEEIRNLSLYDIIAHSKESVNRNLERVLKSGGFVIGERRWRRKDGTVVDVDVTVSVIKQNRQSLCYVIARDITAKKKLEAELIYSEQKIRNLVSSISDHVYSVSLPDFKPIYASPGFEKIYGYSMEELARNPNLWFESIHPHDQPRIKMGMAQLFRLGSYDDEHRIITKQGKIRWIRARGWVKYDENGKPYRLDGINTDITAGKLAGEAVKESEERFRSVIQTANDAIVMSDWCGCIIDWNAGAEKIFGYTKQEVLNKPLTTIVPNRLRGEFQRNLFQLPQAEARPLLGKTVEFYGVRKDGSEFPVEISFSAWKQGEMDFFCGIVRDITERRLYEKKIQSSLNEKELLLKEIHHRVNNNLQLISSMVKLHGNTVEQRNLTDCLHCHQQIHSRIRSLSLVHQRLLNTDDLSQLDFYTYTNELVSELITAFCPVGHRPKITVDICGVNLNTDTAVSCGLLMNELLTNSFKHAFNGWDKAEIEITVRKQGSGFVLLYRDNGVGIPAEFNPKNSKSLGFQLIDSLVAQLDGEMKIVRGNGTEIRISFKEQNYIKRF
jgi:PAS domain S-box-containing protein